MRLTRQHKVYVAVLGLAVGALVLDRVVLGTRLTGPAGASAYSLDPDDPLHTPTPAPSAGRSLASRIDEAARANHLDAGEAIDAFSPLRSGPAASASASPESEFNAAHRITAVMVKPSGAAIIDGRCIRVGESIDGYVLRQVGSDQIQLEHEGRSLTVDVSIVPKAGDRVRVSSEKTASAEPR